MDRDRQTAIDYEIKNLVKQQRGINPKLSSWKKIQEQLDKLQIERASAGAERTNRIKKNVT